MSVKGRKNNWERKKSVALGETGKKEVFLHRNVFKGNYAYNELEERLGRIKILSGEGYNYRWRHYSDTGMIWHNKRKLRVFVNAKEPYMPQCFIEISNPSLEYLIELNEAVPNLNIHLLEYTLDLYRDSSGAVRRLFNVLPKYYYVPHARKVRGPRGRNKQSNDFNRTLYIGKLKIYERAKDKEKMGDGWRKSELDRVRIEYEATEDFLSYNGINSLNDLIVDCNFEKIFLKRFQFKVFRNSGQFPKENDRYDKENGLECFQKEYLKAKRLGIEYMSQRIKDNLGFDSLKKSVRRKVKKFDKNWREKLNT